MCSFEVIRQLLGPVHAALQQLLQSLQTCSWQHIAAWADPQLSRQLGRVKTLLDPPAVAPAFDQAQGAAGATAAERHVGADDMAAAHGSRLHSPSNFIQSASHVAGCSNLQSFGTQAQGGSKWPNSSTGGQSAASTPESSGHSNSASTSAFVQSATATHAAACLQTVLQELWPLLHALVMKGLQGKSLSATARVCQLSIRADAAAFRPAVTQVSSAEQNTLLPLNTTINNNKHG